MRLITEKQLKAFSRKIETAINELSLENTVDIPDWVIADYMAEQFKCFNLLVINYKAVHKKDLGDWVSSERD
jgi:hypothetical protein